MSVTDDGEERPVILVQARVKRRITSDGLCELNEQTKVGAQLMMDVLGTKAMRDFGLELSASARAASPRRDAQVTPSSGRGVGPGDAKAVTQQAKR